MSSKQKWKRRAFDAETEVMHLENARLRETLVMHGRLEVAKKANELRAEALDARDIALSEARELRSRLEEALGEARTARANEAEANKRLAEANSRAADLAKQLEEKT